MSRLFLKLNKRTSKSNYHATYAFQSDPTLYSCLNAKELETGAISEVLVSTAGFKPTTT